MGHFLSVFIFIFSLSGLKAWGLDCSKTNARYWMDRAQEIVSLNGVTTVNVDPELLTLEEAILVNAKITKAYAGLYQAQQERSPTFARAYLWLPGAAFASFEVGQVIRHAYLTLGKKKYLKDDLRPKVYGSNPFDEIFLGDQKFTEERTALTLIKGNLAVYHDLYWQHLSTSQCGISTTMRVLEELFNRSANSKEMLHWAMLKGGWDLIRRGEVDEGNLALTRVEQEIVLQPSIYSGALAYLGGKVFAKLARSPIKDPYFSFPDFLEYCRTHGHSENFSTFDSRWPWIEDQMLEMGKFFRDFPGKLRYHHSFMVFDSNRTLRLKRELDEMLYEVH